MDFLYIAIEAVSYVSIVSCEVQVVVGLTARFQSWWTEIQLAQQQQSPPALHQHGATDCAGPQHFKY